MAHRIPVWFSPHHLQGGQQWHDEIGKALARADWFLILLTPSSIRSDWVKHELLFALNSRRLRRRIIPVLLQECDHGSLSWTLAQRQIVDCRRDFWRGIDQLLRVWEER